MEATGKQIARLRRERHLTVRNVSDYMGFNEPQAVYKWQRGDSLPTIENLYTLSKLFDTTLEDIIVGRYIENPGHFSR